MKRLFAFALGAAMMLTLSGPAEARTNPFPHARATSAERPAAADVPLQLGGGKTVSIPALKGKWVWLYFGFANCPGICPFALDWLADEYRRLERPESVQVIFVSVDPQRDTPEELGPYAAYFHPSFWGATGDRAHLDALTRSVGSTYHMPAVIPAGSDYSVGHANTVYVLDPSGRLAASYDPGVQAKPGELASDFNRLDAAAAERAPVDPAATPSAPDTGAAWCGIGPDGASDADHPLMLRAATMGSGTSVLPATTPMRMWSLRTGDWLWMLHGDAVAGLNVLGGLRGDRSWAAV